MEKQAHRERIWDELAESGVARFPFPPHGRIPNFTGAEDAAAQLADLDVWQDAEVIKSNPDSPQLPVRRTALREGKVLYIAVPRLRDERCFLRLDPAEIDNIEHATTVRGSADVGVPMYPDEMEAIDLVIAGSVGVTKDGIRLGKGEGYSDLEFAILQEFDRLDTETPTVTTVHERQVITGDVVVDPWDVPIDWILTPERAIHTTGDLEKPDGVQWEMLTADERAAIPVLDRLHSP